MMPFVSPAPLSACTLTGFSIAYPQPSAMSCTVAGGSGPAMAAKRAKAAGSGADGRAARPNIIITGTGVLTQAGVTTTIWMSTLIDELSTCPVSSFATTGYGPTVSLTVLVTVHVSFGTFGGT